MNVFRKKSVEQTLAETGESGHALKRDLTWWDLAIMVWPLPWAQASSPSARRRLPSMPVRRWC